MTDEYERIAYLWRTVPALRRLAKRYRDEADAIDRTVASLLQPNPTPAPREDTDRR